MNTVPHDLIERLERIETCLELLVRQRRVQDWYDTRKVAEILDRSPYSVREWCRLAPGASGAWSGDGIASVTPSSPIVLAKESISG